MFYDVYKFVSNFEWTASNQLKMVHCGKLDNGEIQTFTLNLKTTDDFKNDQTCNVNSQTTNNKNNKRLF